MQNFIVIVLVALCAGGALAEPSSALQKIIDDCNEEHGAKGEDLHDFFMGKLSSAAVSDNVKCSIHCVMEKNGFMNEAGKFNVDAVRSQLKEEDRNKIEPALQECKDIAGPSHCETAFLVTECLMEHNVPMH